MPIRSTQKSPAELIIEKFDGLSGTARAYPMEDGGPRPVTTIQGWKERGRIPQEHWFGLIAAGEKIGIKLSIEDFIRKPERKPARKSRQTSGEEQAA